MSESMQATVSWLRPALPSPPIRVLVCGEQPIGLLGLMQVIDSAPQRIVRVGTATHFYELDSHPALIDTEVLCLDLGMRLASSLGSLADLVVKRGVKLIVLTEDNNFAQHEDAVISGALGIVMKSHPTSEVLNAIERVHAGEAWVDRMLMATVIKRRSMHDDRSPLVNDEQTRRVASLTVKERQVISMIVEHRGAKGFVVAEALGISEQTLRNRLTFIYDKLGIRGKLDLYLYALANGLGPTGLVDKMDAGREVR